MNKKILTPIFFVVSLIMIMGVGYFVSAPTRTVVEAKGVGANDSSTYFNNAMNNFISVSIGAEKRLILPYDTSPALKADESNYSSITENGEKKYVYEDSTISVKVWKEKIKMKVWSKKSNKYTYPTNEVVFADVQIADASQFRRGWAGSASHPVSDAPTAIFKKYNGIVGISADFYTYRKYGYEYQYGKKVMHKKPVWDKELDILVVDYKGDFNIYSIKDFNNEIENKGEAFTDTIMSSFTFGPVLVQDGKNTHSPLFTSQRLGEVSYVYARACIGQMGPLHYLLCTVGQPGCDMEALADLMAERGCITAYNLDGGQSGTLIYHNKHFNTIAYNKGNTEKYGERPQESIIYFGTAEPSDK